ncbi:MAG: nickel pincer cofactor biosynthesis protein LarC [Deferribacteraceae bacterium]|jgi:uncharacterized protein (TIGR00299 family) protein|nr:nickel pincer cofactor biosynthesis protein LarC [Deferribacteraceae bacterium]
MKILYYDCSGGISGDMNLAAFLDLGMPKDYLESELAKLSIWSDITLEVNTVASHGICGTRIQILQKEKVHRHRGLNDIKQIIGESALNVNIKRQSILCFTLLAEAEAKVHGETVEKIHFHEVGGLDAIADIVGAAVAVEYFNPDMIYSSPVQVGSGFVECAHGILPVPAPATAELLTDVPIKTGHPFETATPTGAAILKAQAVKFTDSISFTPKKTGYGFGTRESSFPNALRIFLGESENRLEEQYLFETTIDDMSPEAFSLMENRLFEAGALDMFKTPVVMKKGRLAVKLSVLVTRETEESVLNVIFKDTSTLGVRKIFFEKRYMERRFEEVNTVYGSVRVKCSYLKDELIKYKAEYSDCEALAIKHGVPVANVYNAVVYCFEEKYGS